MINFTACNTRNKVCIPKKSIVFFIFCFFSLINYTNLYSQISAIGTGISDLDMTNQVSHTSPAITIPTGENRILIVTLLTSSSVNVTGVNFNQNGSSAAMTTTASTGMANSFTTTIYYLAISGTAEVSVTVSVNASGNTPFGIIARACENVDPTNSINTGANQFASNGSNQNVHTDVGDMVIDMRFATGTLTLGAGQTDLAAPLPMNSNQIRSTYKLATSTTTTMVNNLVGGHVITALRQATAAPVTTVTSTPIPTMSQWGMLIFALLILNLGIMFVYQLRLD